MATKLVDIWEIVRQRAAATLPECEVVRDYSPLSRMGELDQKDKPLLCVTLDGKMSENLTRTKVKETLQFSMVVLRSLSAGSAAAATARADDCLEILPKLQTAFYQKTWTAEEQASAEAAEEQTNGETSEEQTTEESTEETASLAPALDGTGLKFLTGTKDGDFFAIEMMTTEDLFFAGTTVYVVYFRDVDEV